MLTKYQLKNARLLLCLRQKDLARILGRAEKTIGFWENGKCECRKDSELAIKFLLTQAGLFAHFRIVYMRKKKLNDVVIPGRAGRKKARSMLMTDALGFKYDK
jgi:DNA-binding XRE family transcriptional regulator